MKRDREPQVTRPKEIDQYLGQLCAYYIDITAQFAALEDSLSFYAPELLTKLYRTLSELYTRQFTKSFLSAGVEEWANQQVNSKTQEGNEIQALALSQSAAFARLAGLFIWTNTQITTISKEVQNIYAKHYRQAKVRGDVIAEEKILSDFQAVAHLVENPTLLFYGIIAFWYIMPNEKLQEVGAQVQGYSQKPMVGDIFDVITRKLTTEKRKLNQAEISEIFGLLDKVLVKENQATGSNVFAFMYTLGLFGFGHYLYPINVYEKNREWFGASADRNEREYILQGVPLIKLFKQFHSVWLQALVDRKSKHHTAARRFFEAFYSSIDVSTDDKLALDNTNTVIESIAQTLVFNPEVLGFTSTLENLLYLSDLFDEYNPDEIALEVNKSIQSLGPDGTPVLLDSLMKSMVHYHELINNETLLAMSGNIEGVLTPDQDAENEPPSHLAVGLAELCNEITAGLIKLNKNLPKVEHHASYQLHDGTEIGRLLNQFAGDTLTLALQMNNRKGFVVAKVSLSDFGFEQLRREPDAYLYTDEELAKRKLVLELGLDLSQSEPELIVSVLDPHHMLDSHKVVLAQVLRAGLTDWLTSVQAELATLPADFDNGVVKGSPARKTGQISNNAQEQAKKRKNQPRPADVTAGNGNGNGPVPELIDHERRKQYPEELLLSKALQSELSLDKKKGTRAEALKHLQLFMSEFSENPTRYQSEKLCKSQSRTVAGPNGELVWRFRFRAFRVFAVSLDRKRAVVFEIDDKDDETFDLLAAMKDKVSAAVHDFKTET